jgi:ABC-type sugar transport system ATPase subunit
MTSVSVRNLWMEYGDQVVLERINLEIAPHSFCSIVGASGCGKTTFLRLLLSQETPTRGTITVDGKPLPDEPGPDRGVVFQRYSVFPHLTVRENVVLGLELNRSRLLGRLLRAFSMPWDWRRHATSIQRRSPVACSSGSPLPRHWSAGRASSCSMSRLARSMPAPVCRCTN